MKRIVLIAAMALFPLLSRAEAPTAGPAADPTAHRHLGLFLRADAGLGYMVMKGSGTMYIDGLTSTYLPFGVTAGYAVIENFIVGGEVWGMTTIAPSPKSPLIHYSNLLLGAVGLNLTYYFMPVNIYVSATPSLSLLRQTYDQILGIPLSGSANTKVGFGGKLAVGKEWWVADHWGVGVALQFFVGINADTTNVDSGITWTTLGGAAAISATYN
ncbi:MAG: hypothetical protein WCK73_02625 [Deltaproteobacteria bacterium]